MSGWDHSLHMDDEFKRPELAFCSCGEELVYLIEFEQTKCLKCIQDQQAKEVEE